MFPELFVILPILAAVALGSYVQTITGFAFGLIFISAVTAFNLLDIATAALMTCSLALVNTTVALRKRERHTLWRPVLTVIFFAVPGVLVGYYLLQFLGASHIKYLKLTLSAVIVLASFLLLVPPKAGKGVSSLPVFAFFGVLGGLVGGLFGVNGPPLIFQFYRQNLPVVVIRDCLLTIFAILCAVRLVFVVAVDGMSPFVGIMILLAIPVTYTVTLLAKKFPPNMSDLTLRRGAALLLLFAAISISLQA
ncbi:MAG: sulfite exporter TauE/SafE family protein [Methylocystaceae bacterium]|nr:sulfite exporter TauE/SafE family protein [Methylocystaceae bacterium]